MDILIVRGHSIMLCNAQQFLLGIKCLCTVFSVTYILYTIYITHTLYILYILFDVLTRLCLMF